MKLLHACTDNELIRQFQQGYEKAFHVLYERHRQEIFATTVFYIKNYTLAEDLSQEIYIKIITAIRENKYCDEGKFIPWALRIVYNHCMDHLRKKNRFHYVPDFDDKAMTNVSTMTTEAKIMKQETMTQLEKLIDKLPPDQKTVVRCRHFEEMSFKEIAQMTNTSVNTTLGRMRYALVHLRNLSSHYPTLRY